MQNLLEFLFIRLSMQYPQLMTSHISIGYSWSVLKFFSLVTSHRIHYIDINETTDSFGHPTKNFHIWPEKLLCPVVVLSTCAKRWRSGSSLACNKHKIQSSEHFWNSSTFRITSALKQVITDDPSHPISINFVTSILLPTHGNKRCVFHLLSSKIYIYVANVLGTICYFTKLIWSSIMILSYLFLVI